MKMLFLLGNPEARYKHTRHNVAWDIIAPLHLAWSEKTKFRALIAETEQEGEKVLFVRPTTYYNNVGHALQAVMSFYKLAASDVLVIHDDLALPFGTLRVRVGGSDAGNNGVKSINQLGDGAAIARLRIGIATERRMHVPDMAFVLERFSASELEAITETIAPMVMTIINDFVTESHQPTSYKLL